MQMHASLMTATLVSFLGVWAAKAEPEPPLSTPSTPRTPPISLNVQNANLRAVLQTLADLGGRNLIAADNVSGTVSLRFRDLDWDQALAVILQSKGLTHQQVGDVIWVAPREALAEQGPPGGNALLTETFRLNYLRADEAANVVSGRSLTATSAAGNLSCSTDSGDIKSGTGNRPAAREADHDARSGKPGLSLLDKHGAVMFDLKSNTLFVRETRTRLDQIKSLLAGLDVPARQIMIEARVVLASDAFGRTLGARLGVRARGHADGATIGIGGNFADAATAVSSGPGVLPIAGVNLGAPAVLGSATSAPSLGLSVLNASANTLLALELQAMEADRRGKIISSPRVITQNRQPAVILQGQKVPNLKVTTSAGNANYEIEYKDALLCLLVEPQILNNDEIILSVSVNKDTTAHPLDLPNGSRLVPIDTKRVRTTVRVKNGETAVLGGIHEQEMLDNNEKVPWLGDVPLLGRLFRNQVKEERKAELMIFLTPHLMPDGSRTP